MAVGESAARLPVPRLRQRLGIEQREALTGYAFISPWIAGFLLFTLIPMVAALALSMTDFDMRRPEEVHFVGLANFQRLLSDPNVAQSLGVTVRFALLTVPLNLAVALGLAVLLNQDRLRGVTIFRTLFYLPIQIPLVASTLVWAGVLNAQTGWLNRLTGIVGLPAIDWIESTTWILPALALIGLWGVGNSMVVFIAGLQSVPSELYDAARVDGAGRVTTFVRITLPLISPVVFYNVLISLILTFQYFTQAYVLTNGRGDPDNASLFYNLNLYREGWKFFDMGYAAAQAWLLFGIVLSLTVLLFLAARRWVYYAGERR